MVYPLGSRLVDSLVGEAEANAGHVSVDALVVAHSVTVDADDLLVLGHSQDVPLCVVFVVFIVDLLVVDVDTALVGDHHDLDDAGEVHDGHELHFFNTLVDAQVLRLVKVEAQVVVLLAASVSEAQASDVLLDSPVNSFDLPLADHIPSYIIEVSLEARVLVRMELLSEYFTLHYRVFATSL